MGRYGGEEFIILLPNTDLEKVYTLANTIRAKISQNAVVHSEQKINVTSSFGISHVPIIPGDQSETIKLAIRKADHALYVAKNRGRNNVQIYKEDLQVV